MTRSRQVGGITAGNVESPGWGAKRQERQASRPLRSVPCHRALFTWNFGAPDSFPSRPKPITMSQKSLRIALGADHGGVDLKDALVAHLKAAGHEVTDFGTHGPESVDYADFANLVGRSVSDGTQDFGVLCCTSGVGVSIAANRHRHVRAANVRSVEEATVTRQHNDANVLCLGGKSLDTATATAMTDAFIATEFEGGRHQRRVCKSSGSRIAENDPELYAAIVAEGGDAPAVAPAVASAHA